MAITTLIRLIAAIALCLALDFVYQAFWVSDYFFRKQVQGFEITAYSNSLVPSGAHCVSNASRVWGLKPDLKLWLRNEIFADVPLSARVKIWILSRLGSLSPALYDHGVELLADPEKPILLLRASNEESRDIYSILRNNVLGQAIVTEHVIVSCGKKQTQESVLYQYAESPELAPVAGTEIRGRIGGLLDLLKLRLTSDEYTGFGLFDVAFAGAEGLMFGFTPGRIELYPYTATGGLKIECLQDTPSCKIVTADTPELEKFAGGLDSRWAYDISPQDANSAGRNPSWSWMAFRKLARSCRSVKIPAIQEMVQAWNQADPRFRAGSRTRLCARVERKIADQKDKFIHLQRKSFGLLNDDQEY